MCEPPLTAGPIVSRPLRHRYSSTRRPKGFRAELVRCCRARPTDSHHIYSVFRRRDKQANSRQLPTYRVVPAHVPWERLWTRWSNGGRRRLWLALLTISAADFGGTFGDAGRRICTPRTVAGPRTSTPPWCEDPKSLCRRLTYHSHCFAHPPTRKDLPLLAHVREVNTDAETAAYLGDGGIRRRWQPAAAMSPARSRTASIVSLEGMTYALRRAHRSGSGQHCGWQFYQAGASDAASHGFKAAVSNMQVGAENTLGRYRRIAWRGRGACAARSSVGIHSAQPRHAARRENRILVPRAADPSTSGTTVRPFLPDRRRSAGLCARRRNVRRHLCGGFPARTAAGAAERTLRTILAALSESGTKPDQPGSRTLSAPRSLASTSTVVKPPMLAQLCAFP